MDPSRERTPEPENLDEPALLRQWLDFHRDALNFKCEGLSDEEFANASVPPSDLTLLSLVRHMTEMEHFYLVWAISGEREGFEWIYCVGDTPEGDIVGVTAEMAGDSLRRWREEMVEADRLLNEFDLDATCPGDGYSLRWNLLKMIQEYARHNGHADLIRQSIDGAVGE